MDQSKSIRKTGTERYEVWEKTELRRSVAGTKVLLSLTEYDLRKETAETKYLSNFDASGYMTSHAATKDRWSRKTDTYGSISVTLSKNIMRKRDVKMIVLHISFFLILQWKVPALQAF